ncbi:MAG: flagellar hook-length control protein FliK [Planctomycetota bacterium]
MQLTPFGRIDVALEDLPRIDLGTKLPRRPQARPAPATGARVEGAPAEPRGFEAVAAEQAAPAAGAQVAAQPRTSEVRERAEVAPEADPASDGSEGAAAVTPHLDLDTPTGEGAGARSQPARRTRADVEPELAQTATQVALPQGAVPGVADAGPVAPAVEPAAVEALAPAKAATPTPQGAFQALAQRSIGRPAAKAAAAPPPRPRSPIRLAQAERRSILESVTMALGEGRGEAVLHLDPKELGSLTIRLALEGKRLVLRMSAERDEVAQALRDGLPELEAMLAGQASTSPASRSAAHARRALPGGPRVPARPRGRRRDPAAHRRDRGRAATPAPLSGTGIDYFA